MIEAISRDGDWRAALFDGAQSLLQPVGATGAAMVYDGQVFSAGDVPGTQEIRAIAAWLDQKPPEPFMATVSLGLEEAGIRPNIQGSHAASLRHHCQVRPANILFGFGRARPHRHVGWRSVQSRHYR